MIKRISVLVLILYIYHDPCMEIHTQHSYNGENISHDMDSPWVVCRVGDFLGYTAVSRDYEVFVSLSEDQFVHQCHHITTKRVTKP
jgi:hypothetical protein